MVINNTKEADYSTKKVIELASPQLESGYTRLANSILEALAKTQLNGTAWRIIIVVFRYTYGFGRKETELSESFIARATGVHRKQINREINTLISSRVLIVKRPATFNTPRIIAFNKNFESWKVSTKKLTGNELDALNKTEDTTANELVDTTGNELVDQEINTIKKEVNKITYSPDQLEILELWNAQDIVKHGQTAEIQKSIKNALKKHGKDAVVTSIINYARILHDQKYFYNHIFRLDKFLKQSNGLQNFLEDGQAWINYENRVVKGNDESIGDNASEPKGNSEYAKLLDGI